MDAYGFFIGWGIVFTGLWGLTKFEWGRALSYYGLWLLIVLTLVTHASSLELLISETGLQTTQPDILQTGPSSPNPFIPGTKVPI